MAAPGAPWPKAATQGRGSGAGWVLHCSEHTDAVIAVGEMQGQVKFSSSQAQVTSKQGETEQTDRATLRDGGTRLHSLPHTSRLPLH